MDYLYACVTRPDMTASEGPKFNRSWVIWYDFNPTNSNRNKKNKISVLVGIVSVPDKNLQSNNKYEKFYYYFFVLNAKI